MIEGPNELGIDISSGHEETPAGGPTSEIGCSRASRPPSQSAHETPGQWPDTSFWTTTGHGDSNEGLVDSRAKTESFLTLVDHPAAAAPRPGGALEATEDQQTDVGCRWWFGIEPACRR